MIYVHVPFCRSFCTYCGFYSEICSRKAPQQVQNRFYEDYADAVCEEIEERAAEVAAARDGLDTLYIGGGTPSVLPVEVLGRIVRALGPATYAEFTVEVNPDDVAAAGAPYVAALRGLGVNRISMGVQSFDDGILRWMNRRHDAARAREAFRLLRAGGFDNISIDLIFGLSHLTDSILENTVREAIALGPEHISAYQLSIEEGSALEQMVADGRYAEAPEDQCRHQYDMLCSMLSEAGYVHYEVSNWALSGREAVHNSAYWRRVPYLGLGPAAHSFSLPAPSAIAASSVVIPAASLGSALFVPGTSSPVKTITTGESVPASKPGVRSWNSQELARRDAAGRLLRWHSESEILSAREAAEETIMLALRTASGLPLAQLHSLSPDAPVDALLSEGSLQLVPPPASSVLSRPAPPHHPSHTTLSQPVTSSPLQTSSTHRIPLPSSSSLPPLSSHSSLIPSQPSSSPSQSSPSPSRPSSALSRPWVRIPEDRFFVSDAIISRLLPEE